MNLGALPERLADDRARQRQWARKMKGRRWIRKPRRETRDSYLTLVERAVDGAMTDAEAAEFTRLSRRMPNAVKARLERQGRQLALLS